MPMPLEKLANDSFANSELVQARSQDGVAALHGPGGGECATQRPTVLRGRDWALHWAGTVAAG